MSNTTDKRPAVGSTAFVRPLRFSRLSKYRACPKCQGYELERGWCKYCSGSGVIEISLIPNLIKSRLSCLKPNDQALSRLGRQWVGLNGKGFITEKHPKHLSPSR